MPIPASLQVARWAFFACAVLFGTLDATARQLYCYQIRSQPQSIIPTSSDCVAAGTPITTPDVAYGLTSGYGFCYWTINGVRQAGVTGAALTAVSLPMTNDEVAVAVFVALGDSTGTGLQDWYQEFWLGNTNNASASDPTGDGFALFDDLERDYCPVIANVTTNGGAILRLSDLVNFRPGPPEFYYEMKSQPLGVIPSSSGYVLPGTPVPTPDIPYGQSSGYYFGYWTINGVRQAGVTGAALTDVSLPMTNDEVAVAVFFPAGGGGLQYWYQWFWFGNTNQTSLSDPTGDGFLLPDDLARDYCPVIANFTTNGGAIMRLSDSTVFIGGQPVASTLVASGVTSTSATLNGAVSPDGLATTVSFIWGASTNLGRTNTSASLGAIYGSLHTSTIVTGLTPGIKYFYIVLASNVAGVAEGKVLSFTTATPPVVVTLSAGGVTGTSATLNGTIYPLGSVTTASFVWGTSASLETTNIVGSLASAFGSQNVSNALTGLTPGTTYYYAAVAANAGGTIEGAVRSFTTAPAPVVTTLPASGITGTSATLNGTVYPLGLVTAASFVWGATTNLGNTNTVGNLASAFGSQNVSNTLTGLTPGKTYYYAAAAANLGGATDGAVRSFTTASVPVVTTLPASAITGNSAILNGTIYPLGSPTAASFLWGATTNLGRTNTVGSLASAFGSQNVSNTLTGLTPGTTYYYAVAATNGGGAVKGMVRSFTTPSLPVTTTLAASGVMGGSATLNGTVYPEGSITKASFIWGTSTNLGTTNAAGTLVSAFGSQNVSNTLSGLTPGTTYYFAVTATNIGGVVQGMTRSFTIPSPAVVTTLSASGVTGASATLNGTVYPLGSATTASFVWGVTTNLGTTNAAGTLASAFGSQNVSNTLTGLTPATTYYFAAAAANLGGTSRGALRSFTTGPTGHGSHRDGKLVYMPARILTVTNLPDGTKHIDAAAAPGETYIIEAASDPVALSWTPISTNTATGIGRITFIDPQSTNAPRQFYRLRRP